MKKLFKNLSKAFSLLLIIAISFITLTACSNNDNKQASVTPAVESISDTNNSEKENIAEEVTENEESNNSEETNNENTPVEDSSNNETSSSDENTVSTTPVALGIYKFEKLDLSFDDIYYEDEAALLDYFKTRDINGVYDAVYNLGFESFLKSITYYSDGESSYEIVISFNKNGSDGSEFAITPLYVSAPNTYSLFVKSTIYALEDGKIVEEASKPKLLIDEETNNISILIPFKYINSEVSDEVILTPLYVKANLSIIDELDIMDATSVNMYNYVENSANIESVNGFVNEAEAMSNIANLLGVAEDEIIETISNFNLAFTADEKLYIVNNVSNLIITEKIENSTNYLVNNAFYFNVVNENYDFETGLKTLNIQIQIDENTIFTCEFVAELV